MRLSEGGSAESIRSRARGRNVLGPIGGLRAGKRGSTVTEVSITFSDLVTCDKLHVTVGNKKAPCLNSKHQLIFK